MNKKCIIKNGIAVIKDENGLEREVTCCDNLDDILVQENVIETIQNVLNALEDSSSSFLKHKLGDIVCIPLPVIETILVPSIMSYMTNVASNGVDDGMIYTRFGLMDKGKFLAIFIAFFLPYALSKSKKWYREYIDDKRQESGRILTIRELKNNLLAQKDRLKEMHERSAYIELSEKSYSVDDGEALEILREYISLYYDIGYNFKIYCKYYRENGDLPENFKQEYNEEGLKLIKGILERSCNSTTNKVKTKYKK